MVLKIQTRVKSTLFPRGFQKKGSAWENMVPHNQSYILWLPRGPATGIFNSALCPLVLVEPPTDGFPPYSTQRSQRRTRENTTPLPIMSASARDTEAEVANLNSLSSCPRYSKTHLSEESPARHEYERIAHSIVVALNWGIVLNLR